MKSTKKPTKNIVVCADGTGNKGGSSPDSNVYRIYQMVKKNFDDSHKEGGEVKEQILFYENGVGTAKNTIIKALSAGVGFGFKENVCDLYKFLSRNYEKDDKIYFFGFSRGASTVRACNGMISICGLVKSEGLRNSELEDKVKEAYEAYEVHRISPKIASNIKNNESSSWGAVNIQFLGVWDTVVALGFPKRTDITGPVSRLVNNAFYIFESFFDKWFPHNFYHYRLTENVLYACQALAIDDERTAFWPFVWKEKNIGDGVPDRTKDNVNQVWFTGMHANVGGGYERDGLAMIPLYWLMKQAQQQGLIFNSDAKQLVQDRSHAHGHMYDTRSGIKMIYRYHPREIENLCSVKVNGTEKRNSILLDNIKIHSSVIERMRHRTANYVPGHLPARFDVVDSEGSASIKYDLENNNDWKKSRKKINETVLERKRLYSSAAASFLGVLLGILYYWNCPTENVIERAYLTAFADILDYFTPDMLNNLIDVVVVKHPQIMGVALGLVWLYARRKKHLIETIVKEGEALRHVILDKTK